MAAYKVLGLLALFAVASNAMGARVENKANPISRVVDLLQGLVKKVEADGEAELEMFESYECWYKTVVSTKKGSNSAAEERIKNLEQYIKDIESGKIDFTNEVETLEKEQAELEGEISKATEIRNAEERDFLAAKEEMEAAITSLEKAVQVLGDATADSTGLLSFKDELQHVTQVGESFLSSSDVSQLSRALGLEDPNWEELAKSNTHNQKYKARSSKIQEILADMLETFQDNLADAIKMEKEKKKTFETLMTSKNTQLSAAKDALASTEQETGARNLNKDEAKAEKENLEEQVKNDKKYIEEAEKSYAAMSAEWKERQRLRTAEIASISEASAVLTSDDAKDTMKKSFDSQGYSFLQHAGDSEHDSHSSRAVKAKDALKRATAKTKDYRLALLVADISAAARGHANAKGRFDKVMKSLDEMMSDLHKESDADLEKKETCEKERDDNTNEAKNMAYAIDTQTSVIVRKKHHVEELEAKIAACEASIKDLKLKLEEATANRMKEKAQYKASKADDEAAKGLVTKAKEVLQKFYDDEGLGLAQTGSHARQPMAAGEAPPPPPAMWKEPYGGAKGESNGIQSILEMIADDIQKDIDAATATEETAIKDYNDFKADTNEAVSNLEAQITDLETEISEAEKDMADARNIRADKKETMESAMAYLRSIATGCDYMAANFEYRLQNRYEEIDGLLEARAALGGGSTQGSA